MLRAGLRSLSGDAICTQTMGTFAAGTFLVAMALQMGASNIAIGLIAALGPLAQILQVPAVVLIDRIGSRRAVVVLASLVARAFWLLAAATPWLVPEAWRIEVFLAALTGYYGLGTISGLAFNTWMRDLIPESIRGSNLATRLAVATAVAAVLSLVTGAGVDWFKQFVPEAAVYSAYLVLAWVAGWAGGRLVSVSHTGTAARAFAAAKRGRDHRGTNARPEFHPPAVVSRRLELRRQPGRAVFHGVHAETPVTGHDTHHGPVGGEPGRQCEFPSPLGPTG